MRFRVTIWWLRLLDVAHHRLRGFRDLRLDSNQWGRHAEAGRRAVQRQHRGKRIHGALQDRLELGGLHKLKLTGTVYSGLTGTTPITISSSQATIIQGIDPGKYDTFTMEAPIKVLGISLTIKALIVMPVGTITKTALAPFNSVALAPGNATVTYSDSSASTVLAIQTGTLTATAK